MEYGSTVRQCNKGTALLDRLQTKALSLCLQLPSTSSLEAIEVAAGILPLESMCAEIAVSDIANIQPKAMDKPIKKTLSNSLQSPAGARCITSMSLALSQAREMKAITEVDIDIIEQEMDYEAGSLALTKKLPFYSIGADCDPPNPAPMNSQSWEKR